MSSMRSIWKGHISIGLMTVPVKVYNAVSTEDRVSFNELHVGCGGRVGRSKPCKKCGETLEGEQVVKGFEYATDEYVTFTPEEITAIKLRSTKVVEVQGFVPLDEIEPMMVDAPYYVAPDGKVALGAYDLVARALSKRRVAGVGKIVLRDREDTVAVVPAPANQTGLMLLKLRQPNEVRDFRDVPGISAFKADRKQVELALTLVDSMRATLAALDLKDRYREALQELVEAKVNKREVTLVQNGESKVTSPGDIMSVLEASIAAAAKRRKIA